MFFKRKKNKKLKKRKEEYFLPWLTVLAIERSRLKNM